VTAEGGRDFRRMKIALVTDTHLSPRDCALADNWRAVDRWIGAAGADLVVHLGDISADGVAEVRELTHAHGLIAGSGRDVVFLPGNHDVGDGPGEAGAVSHEGPLRSERLADFRRVFGPDFWSLGAEGWQLLGLNAQLFGAGGEDEERQWAWLEAVLAKGQGPLGVFCHKPLVPVGPAAADALTRYPVAAARARLVALLAGRDLRFVASGHTHQTLRFAHGGAEHLWVPSCAFVIPDEIQPAVGEKRVGAVLLELSPDGHRFTLADPAGLRRHDLLDLADLYPVVAGWKARGRDGV
jgi:3',5'-cyclic AMP phosphodiesterase CpdA